MPDPTPTPLSRTDASTTRGWLVTFAGTGINLALGVLYAWSMFKGAIQKDFGWDPRSLNDPYSVCCLVFAFSMILAGRCQDRFGPRITATLGGVLVGAGFVLCSAACLLTSDAESSERREGTLGLVLLTKAGDLDVLLGKFCSNGLTSLLALLALVPVFAIPVLGGGVTGTEILRKGLALGNALVFALAVGIYASAPECDRVRAARKANITSVLWNGVPLVGVCGRRIRDGRPEGASPGRVVRAVSVHQAHRD